jgi:hypothetical protein
LESSVSGSKRVDHEVNYQLCECSIESSAIERQLFCGPALDPYPGIAIGDRGHKTDRENDGEHSVQTQAAGQLAGPRPWTTANTQRQP